MSKSGTSYVRPDGDVEHGIVSENTSACLFEISRKGCEECVMIYPWHLDRAKLKAVDFHYY